MTKDSRVRVRKVRKRVLPNHAKDRRTRLPFASSTTTLIGSDDDPEAPLAPLDEEPPPVLPFVPVGEVVPVVPLAFPASKEAAVLAGAEGLAASGFCASGMDLSSCIVSLIADAAGLAEVGRPDSPGCDTIGEADAPWLRTRTFALGFPLDRTALAS